MVVYPCIPEALTYANSYWLILPIVFCCIFQLLYRQYRAPLHEIPGPWLARHTRLWKLYQYSTGQYHFININLHRKYGPIVRVAPGEYSLAGQEAMKTIYASGNDFIKSNWYRSSVPGTATSLFTERDEKWHGILRRKYANSYSVTALLEQEQYVDSTTEYFKQRLHEFVHDEKSVDFGQWLKYYAFDVIGEITFAKRLGFLEGGRDINGILKALDTYFVYASLVGVYWEIHRFTIKIMSLMSSGGPAVMAFAQEEMELRLNKTGDTGRRDFLSRFVAQHKQNPTLFTQEEVKRGCWSNVAAGSDTTAISLRTVFYNLMKHPQCTRALRHEIDTMASEGKISSPVTYRESLTMPYLQAVLKESFRIHGATGFPLERIVPSSGATINGKYFPAGSVVGVNSWVLHYDKEIYGDDVETFRPERWLVEEDQYRKMDRCIFSFGGGARTCIGKNISIMEMSKLVPELIRNFDIELVDPKANWRLHTAWFCNQYGLYCKVSERARD
ncbi:cytochrome P450 family protein [Limtongia smithiae]|uniref:cytochrome P450 family protein n=1 Tax=Limtongia smithiae TaxID=1125753 RepID=UPI0034CEE16E